MAYTFFKARGVPVGKSLVEDDKLDAARDVERAREGARRARSCCRSITSSRRSSRPARRREVLAVDDPAIGDRMGLDIGPKTVAGLSRACIAGAKTVVWNGPMGVFEIDAFAKGTIAVAQAVADVKGTTIIGGGDSIAAVDEGRRRRSDHAHLDRRRRVARVPRRPHAAGRRGADGRSS